MSLSPVAARIGEINFEGLVVPLSWFQWIKRNNGSPDLLAMAILSEIVYWYRPTVVRDETSGNIVEVRNKFKADKLQKDYADFAQLFGVSKKQVKAAIKLLEDLGLVTKELRNVQLENGRIVPNVLFIEPVAEMVAHITQPRIAQPNLPSKPPIPSSEGRICVPGGTHINPAGVTCPSPEGQTNTKNTTQNTTQDSSTYVHATACEGGGGNQNGEAGNKEVTMKPPTNKEVIAELVGEYRKVIPEEQHAPGDYSFIGRLYNNYGYDVVLEAIQELGYRVDGGFLPDKPLMFLKYLVMNVAGAQAQGAGVIATNKSRGNQGKTARRSQDYDEEWYRRMAEYDKLWKS